MTNPPTNQPSHTPLNGFTEDQIEAMRQDYLYELATETGFGAPKLWNGSAPRNFEAYVQAKKRINDDLSRGLDLLSKAGGSK